MSIPSLQNKKMYFLHAFECNPGKSRILPEFIASDLLDPGYSWSWARIWAGAGLEGQLLGQIAEDLFYPAVKDSGILVVGHADSSWVETESHFLRTRVLSFSVCPRAVDPASAATDQLPTVNRRLPAIRLTPTATHGHQ